MNVKLISLAERIYKKLLEDKRAISSKDIVKEFMKIDKITPQVAEKLVAPVLSNDSRFVKTNEGLWKVKKNIPIENLPLSNLKFIIFFIQGVKEENAYKLIETADNLKSIKEYSSFLLYKGGYNEEISDINTIIKNVNDYIFIPYDVNSLKLFKKWCRGRYYIIPELLTISIRAILKVVYPGKRLKSWNDLIREFSIINVESKLPSSKTKTLLNVFEHLLDKLYELNIDNLGNLLNFINKDRKKIDFSNYYFDRDFLNNIPEYPGVYQFYNRKGDIIYIGKTNNLRRRINSYFWNTGESLDKIKGILDEIFKIEYKIMGSELEAIIEEYKSIKSYNPKFNTRINIPERKIETSRRIVLLPSIDKNKIVLFFLSNGLPLIKEESNCNIPNSIVNRIAEILNATGYFFDPAKILLVDYLKRYGENINIIEIDNYGDSKALIESFVNHCKEMESIITEKKSYI